MYVTVYVFYSNLGTAAWVTVTVMTVEGQVGPSEALRLSHTVYIPGPCRLTLADDLHHELDRRGGRVTV